MEPLQKEKRPVAVYLAYRKRGDEYEFFLQKRSADAPRGAGKFGVFGGGIDDGESFEAGLYREINEELHYRPTNHRYFSQYEHAQVHFDVFIEEVGPDFEAHIVVSEGDYGKFFTEREAREEPLVTDIVRLMMLQISEYLARESV